MSRSNARMKTIGLLGGMSWESTELYYRRINEETRRARGGLHSAPIAMVSVDFQEIEVLQHRGDWTAAGEILATRARQASSRAEFLRIIEQLNAAGAEGVIEGCTEIVMLVQQSHTSVRLFDTTEIHAQEAVAWALR